MGAPLLDALAAGVGGYPAVLALAAVMAVVIYGFHPIQRWRYRHIPGPPFRWLLGGLPDLRTGLIPTYPAWAAQYAPHGVFKVFLGAIPHVVVTDPVLVRRVLTLTGHKYEQPYLAVSQLEVDFHSIHVVNSYTMGPEWKEQRNLYAPFFSPGRLESYLPGMLRSLGRFEGVLDRAAAAGTSINLCPIIETFALDAFATSVVGIPFEMLAAAGSGGGLIPGTSLAEKLAWSATTLMSYAEASVPLALLYLFPGSDAVATAMARLAPSTKMLDRHRACAFIVSTYGQLVTACRAGEGGVYPDSFAAAVAAWRDKESGEPKSLLWAASVTSIFVMLGSETVSTALAFTFYFLSQNKDKEAAVLAEVDAFGRDRVPTSLADLEELPYLNAALKEAMRLMPPLPVTWRQAKEDMQLGPYTVPDGTWLHVCLFDTHRNGDHWEEPEEFMQERFWGGESEKHVNLPFSAGARRCPGYRLGMMEGVLTLLRVYQRFTFELEPGQVPLAVHSLLTLEPTAGVWARVVRREDP